MWPICHYDLLHNDESLRMCTSLKCEQDPLVEEVGAKILRTCYVDGTKGLVLLRLYNSKYHQKVIPTYTVGQRQHSHRLK